MGYLIFILITLALFAGFLLLSCYEVHRGARIFASERARLDEWVAHVKFIFEHVDFGSFLREELNHAAHQIAHSVAHFSLKAVRATERFLTRLVLYLRTQRAVDVTPHENAREFVKTLSDFKGHLENTHPKIPDIYPDASVGTPTPVAGRRG